MSHCLQALLHRAVLRKPFGILKYAMTLDGKIATSVGHAAWISSPVSRQHVFETRARSDAVVVGGQTVLHVLSPCSRMCFQFARQCAASQLVRKPGF